MPATPDERVKVVNESWVDKWFKYVTPETWETSNYPAAMFANDLDRAEQVRQQIEAAPLPVKVRYLAEFMASDDTSQLANLNVPLLALRPGFDEKVLADPANSWYKTSFQDSWDAFAKNSRIQLLTIPNARALILDDQPKLTDDAIATFVEHVSKPPEGSLLLEPENLRMGISGRSHYRQPGETDGTFPFLHIMVALTLLLIAEGT